MASRNGGREQQVQGLSFPFAGDRAGGKDRCAEDIKDQHVSDVEVSKIRLPKKQDGHQRNREDHAQLDHEPQHQRTLAEQLRMHFLVVDRIRIVGHERSTPWGRKQIVWELVSLDDQSDGFFLLVFQIDYLVALAADIGWIEQPIGRHREEQSAYGHRDRRDQGGNSNQSNVRLGSEHGPTQHAENQQGQDDDIADDQR